MASNRDLSRSLLWRVFGINILVRLIERPPESVEVQCPRGHGILYGQVIVSGDGFEPEPGAFRQMPTPGSIVCFEEFDENVEGYYFYLDGEEHRILSLDKVILSFPPPGA